MSTKKSKYREKVEAGNQMYGPGCCAHKVPPAQIERRKQEAAARGHFRESYKGPQS